MSDTTPVSVNGSHAPASSAQTPESSSPPELPKFTQDLLMEDYKQRRQEIVDYSQRSEANTRQSLILTGVIWSWLATQKSGLADHFEKLIAFIPAMLMLFFWYRWREMERVIFMNAEYLRDLEKRTEAGPLWEAWLFSKRDKDPSVASFAWSGNVFWRSLIALNLLLAILFVFRKWFGG